MGWAVDAYKAQQSAASETTNAIANATNVILQGWAKQRDDWLKQLELESHLGEEQRNELRQKLANGFGLTGFIKNLAGANSEGYKPVQSGIVGAGGSTFTQQEQVPIENRKDKELLQGGEAAGLGAKLEALKKLNPAKYKEEMEKINAQGLTSGKVSGVTIGENGSTYNNPSMNPYGYDEQGNLVKSGEIVPVLVGKTKINNADKIAQKKTLGSDVAQQEYKNLQADQALSDKTIDAENRAIDQRNKIAKMKNDNIVQASGSYKADPNGYIANVLSKEGILVDEYKGSFSNMTSQCVNQYQRAIDIAVKNGDFNTAEKLNRKYKVDMYAIHKNWLDKPNKGDIEDLFRMPKGGGGKKIIQYNVKDKDGNPIDTIEGYEGDLLTAKSIEVFRKRHKLPNDYKIEVAGKADQLTPKEIEEANKIQQETGMKKDAWDESVAYDKLNPLEKVKLKFGGGTAKEYVAKKESGSNVNIAGQSSNDKVEIKRMPDGTYVKFVNGKPVK